ncbi:adhesion G protein-coupled receptor L2-like [Ptychodera flava]|uniref:adhesion G protein-coupled receptor L2-like n=1 Tax=Ptychodera flava TaxID=63121 RepID=UPI00396A7A46
MLPTYAFLIALAAMGKLVHSCPVDWTYYEGRCYQYNKVQVNFDLARAKCHADGAELPILKNPADNEFVRLLVLDTHPSVYDIWIGLIAVEIDSVRTFLWLDNSSVAGFENWFTISTEPNNMSGDENCCFMVLGNGEWGDYKCTNSKYFMCVKNNTIDDDYLCESKWRHQRQHCYKMVDSLSSHPDADTACDSDFSANLATVLDAESNMLVTSFSASELIWIGLKREVGSYQWMDGTVATLEYTNWRDGVPSDASFCTYIEATTGKWITSTCTDPHKYVCSKDTTWPTADHILTFDTVSDLTLIDTGTAASGVTLNGAAASDAIWAIVKYGIRFSGVSYAEITSPVACLVQPSTGNCPIGVTISFWVKLDDVTGVVRYIVSSGAEGSNNHQGIAAFVDDSDNFVVVVKSATTMYVVLGAPSNFPFNEWLEVTVKWEDSAGLSVLRDGSSIGSDASGTPEISSLTSTSLLLGVSKSLNDHFIGALDEFYVWQGQVEDNMLLNKFAYISEWTLTQTEPLTTTVLTSTSNGDTSTNAAGTCDPIYVYGIQWPVTSVGQYVEIPCQGIDTEAIATRYCTQENNTAFWDEPDMTQCYSSSRFSELYMTVETLSRSKPSNLEIAYGLLENSTDLVNMIHSTDDVTIMAALTITTSEIASRDIEREENSALLDLYFREYLRRVSKLLGLTDSWASVASSLASPLLSKLLWNTELLAKEYANYQLIQGQTDIPDFPSFNNLYVELRLYMNESFNGWTFIPSWYDEEFHYVNLDKRMTDNIIIPKKSVSPGTNFLSIVGIAYRNLESWFGTEVDAVLKDAETERNYVLNSRIISAMVSPPIVDPEVPVEITLHHLDLSPSFFDPTCVFWKFLSSDGSEGVWSTDGCKMKPELSKDDVTVCQCYHLTSFAILMQHEYVEIDRVHDFALSIITYIGCTISLIALSITWVIFQIIRSISCERNSIHKNLVFAIGVSLIVFLVGINATENAIACTFIAVFLHYFLLSSFAWMLVEGLYLYTQIVKVFTSGTSKMRIYYIIGYVCPGIFVGISAAARPEGYGTPSYCWLSSENNLTWAFLGPVLGIIGINIYLLTRVMMEIVSVQGKHVDKSTKLTNLKNNAKATAILLPILGLTWIFGIFAINERLVVFQYLFTIFNAFQGLFIFVFHCAMNSEVRSALKRKQRNWALTKSSFGTPSVGVSPDNTKDRSTIETRTRTNSATIASRQTTITSMNVSAAISISAKTGSPLVVTNLEEAIEECEDSVEMQSSTSSVRSQPRSQHPAALEKHDRDNASPTESNELDKYAVLRNGSGVSRASSVATKMTEVSD